MGQADYFKQGDWNALCDRCNFKYKASDLKLEYTGLRVCKWCWDPRHPQERLRVRPDNPSVPWVRTDSLAGLSAGGTAYDGESAGNSTVIAADSGLTDQEVTLTNSNARAGCAIAGIAISGSPLRCV